MVLLKNKKVNLNYEIKTKLEAGIELHGFEVKSVRQKNGSLEGSYVTLQGNEAFLVNCLISPYQVKNTPKNYNPRRNRKLLLNKKEIKIILDAKKSKALTIVPISMYNSGGVIKVEVGIGRGKKKYDKREDLKKETSRRDIEREVKQKFL
jgi:SsrA-binding protein